MTASSARLARHVAITGASRGLGRIIAQAFVDCGDRVFLLARDSAELAATASELGRTATPIAVDLERPIEIRHAFREIAETIGSLDILINNAGVGFPRRLSELTDEDLHRQVAVNLTAPLLCIQAALPLLSRSELADIVCVSSESVLLPFPQMGVYAATKSGLETACTGLRSELAELGIRLAVARVGQIAGTGFADAWTPDERSEAVEAWQASGHLAFAGDGIDGSAVAQMIMAMVDLARGARCDLVQIRSATSH